jgi:hypothetical protein
VLEDEVADDHVGDAAELGHLVEADGVRRKIEVHRDDAAHH